MSVAIESDSGAIPDQLIDQLTKGYDALTDEVRQLNEQRRALENKLSWAKQQYLDALKRYSPVSASQDFRVFLGELDEAAATEKHGQTGWLDEMSKSTQPVRKTKAYDIQKASDARSKLMYRRQVAIRQGLASNIGRIAETAGLERDFTTSGRPSSLKCPYVPPKAAAAAANNSTIMTSSNTGRTGGASTPRSSMSRGAPSTRRSKRTSFHDPIRAETCGNDAHVPPGTPSVDGSVPMCPIRFLDQHSPEEVAEYFEKHKHELPQNHKACVIRYQSNEDQIKELDQKYGNLVSMIQGLGQKHQPMLPEDPEDEDDKVEPMDDDKPKEFIIPDEMLDDNDRDRIKRWARTVDSSESMVGEGEIADVVANLPSPEAVRKKEKIDSAQDDGRESRFDRPLKEVRLGESPSRPWGVQVPASVIRRDSALTTKSEDTASQVVSPEISRQDTPKAIDGAIRRCPFGFDQPGALPSATVAKESPAAVDEPIVAKPQVSNAPVIINTANTENIAKQELQPTIPMMPQMTFTGPVFIGYSMEQALELLRLSKQA